jgi:glycyl-tRNA synthetase beta chain
VTYTPRRLTLLAYELQSQQEDLDIVKTGPAKRIAFQEDGSPSQALNGFLRSNSAAVADVIWQDNGKGEVAALRILQPGLPTEQLLPAWIDSLLKTIPFPKKMKWGKGGLDFARPIRWLICLWERDILPVKVGGIMPDRISRGNRFKGLESAVEISSPADYFSALKQVNVMAERHERYKLIKSQLEGIFPTDDYQVDLDEGLLQTVTDLVEFPTAVVAEFEEKFLILPDKIITSTISTNQKYFAVTDKDGKLSNKFVFISNGNPEWSEIIRQGNEKVVKPRLEDAMWYYQEDTKKPLEAYVPALKDVVFQAKLGTLKEKTDRVVEIASYLGQQLNLSESELVAAQRTALLSKADLVTKMLGEKEFTKLQGYIGMHYALASGETEQVATGIYEHYLPRGQNDELPQTMCGSLVAVADKLDTVCGIIGIGMLPTGSADPFALRRAANGIVQIIAERKWDLDISSLIDFSLNRFSQPEINSAANQDIILNYFHQRINWYLQQLKIDYDVIDSVMHIDYDNLLHLIERARALQDYKTNEDFVRLVIGFKRVSNIIKDEKQKLTIIEKLFTEAAEADLYSALRQLEGDINMDLNQLDYTRVLNRLVAIRPAIDKFFDDVLVNIEDVTLRQNRYALLQEIRNAFLQVADLSLLVVEGK